ncbi:EAL domain-containing protein [Motilimonas cestriensis]|uniref:EAL domain-containing protein n=1 Tax=Motilimonas cestriensis TaxID=2742685 RepID=UPI003DA2CB3D
MFLNYPNMRDSKILVIDDTLNNVLMLKEILKGCGQLFFAESAKEAIERLPNLLPDIILLDIVMPEMDGWAMCEYLKNDVRYENIPIIFITGHDEKEYEKLSLELGGIDFISKPFNPKICRLRVQNHLKLHYQTKLIKQGREQLQKMVKQVPVLITYWDVNWKNLFSNDYQGTWFGLPHMPEDNVGMTNIFPHELCQAIQSQAIQSQATNSDEVNFFVEAKVNGRIKHYQVFQSPFQQVGNTGRFLVTLIDVSEAKEAKMALYSEKERLRVTLNSIGDAVIATDDRGCITFMNPIAERLTGWRFCDAKKQKIDSIMPLQDANTKRPLMNPLYLALKEQRILTMALNCELVTRSGATIAVDDSAAPIRNLDGEVIGAIMVFHDVSEAIATAMAMASKMSHLANHDQLTNLPNRILLQDRLSVACSAAFAAQKKVGLLLIDIDHFKYLNDSLGHHFGDELICLMAKRLKALLPESYTLARLGGDEFVILMTGIRSPDLVSALADKIVENMHEQFKLAEQFYSVSVSVGVSIFPDDAEDTEQLMRHADVAMYRAKQEGRNRYSFFSNELEAALLQRHQQEKTLRAALKDNNILVYYQPKYDLVSERIVGAEALARLQGDDGTIISPAQFIPLAEESGLIVELGEQVLYKACQQAKNLLLNGANIPISVNVAAAQFASPELEQHILNALSQCGLPSFMLELEITETALMIDPSLTQKKLNKLKNLGINISIDDFGTGYSSLSYLKTYNVDIMKIDMSFIRDMLSNTHDYEIVKTIITLGQSMGLHLVAEGVETKEQRSALIKLGCPTAQGYLYSPPITAEQFISLIKSEQQ